MDGCDGAHEAQGYCSKHYQRLKTHGTTDEPPPRSRRDLPPCTVPGCERPMTCSRLGLCHLHYLRQRKYGSVDIVLPHWSERANAKDVAAKISAAKKGKRFTDAHVRALAESRFAKGPTGLELALRALLVELGVEFYEQEVIGSYTVDAYIPKIGLVVEADGSYWHGDEVRERQRDARLLRDVRVTSVVHLNETQLKPWQPKPPKAAWPKEYRTR